MTYTKKLFLEDVKKEAVALKKNATKGELSKLDFEDLSFRSHSRCVYGQMTGHCGSNRAIELIEKCCVRYVHNCLSEVSCSDRPTSIIARNINGKAQPEFALNRRKFKAENVMLRYLSPLETYLAASFAKNENLIDFLKGNRTDLIL